MNRGNFMNGPNSPMFNSPMTNPQYPMFSNGMNRQYNQFVPITNKVFVSSLEDALNRPADYNSQMVYFDQNKDVLYDVCTNGRGEKSWAIINLALGETSASAMNAQQANNDRLLQRISELEKKLEEVANGKHNAEQTNATNV